MSVYDGPKISTNGLVLALDAGNRLSYVSGSTLWNDISNNNNNGTLTNGPTFNAANGGSIVFDGVDDFVNYGNNTLLNLNKHTICFWFYPKDTTTKEIIVKSSDSNNGVGPYEVFQNTGKIWYRLNFNSNPNTTISGNINYNVNQWNYIVATYDNINMKTYINTVLDINTSFTPILTNSTGDLCIGAYANTQYPLNANMSIVTIYNRAFSASEVLQNFNAQKSRFGL